MTVDQSTAILLITTKLTFALVSCVRLGLVLLAASLRGLACRLFGSLLLDGLGLGFLWGWCHCVVGLALSESHTIQLPFKRLTSRGHCRREGGGRGCNGGHCIEQWYALLASAKRWSMRTRGTGRTRPGGVRRKRGGAGARGVMGGGEGRIHARDGCMHSPQGAY